MSDRGFIEFFFLTCEFVEAKSAIAQAEIDRKQCEMQIQHQKNQLTSKQAEMKKTESSFANDKNELEKFEREIQTCKVGDSNRIEFFLESCTTFF